jgi:hypothetical protein
MSMLMRNLSFEVAALRDARGVSIIVNACRGQDSAPDLTSEIDILAGSRADELACRGVVACSP